ncbi:FadR/GntR family transcriptional regulator [Motilibacter rhizosphaerae]|uniref:FadR/GntR family transcriptional regulator n=1 Tax=Motilibacter rhizosphaerae TaxID=598652 RepID=UPI00102B8FC5
MAGPAASNVEALWSRSLFRPVRDRNTFEVAVERLAQGIRLGVLPYGARLPPERELAERFEVSRVTLREAIKALREAGFVESRRGRGGGTFVVWAGARRGGADAAAMARGMGDRLLDALDFRRVVEPGAAALAATRELADSDRDYLCACLAAAEAPPGDHHSADSGRRLADSRLHLAIAGLAGSESLARAVADVQLRLDELLRAIPVLRHNIAHSDRQHAAIVDAVLGGDPVGARTAMEEHVDGTAALLRGFLS